MQSITPASFIVTQNDVQTRILCSGSWTIEHLSGAARELENLIPLASVTWDMSGITDIDSSGIALW